MVESRAPCIGADPGPLRSSAEDFGPLVPVAMLRAMVEGLHPIEASHLHARRERVFLVLAGTFLGAMAMLNILGITKFIHLGPLELAVGVLPYPVFAFAERQTHGNPFPGSDCKSVSRVYSNADGRHRRHPQ